MNVNNISEKSKKLANLANHFLESSSINWQLGLDDGNSRHLNGDVIKILMNTVTSFIVE